MADILTGIAVIGLITALITGFIAKRKEKSSKKAFVTAGACFALFIVGAQFTDSVKEETTKESAQKSEVESKPASTKPAEPAKVVISEEAITFAREIIEEYPEVSDSHIEVSGDKVVMAIVVSASTDEATAKELGDNFVRALATGVSDVKPPGKDYLGELWEQYNVQIGVGTGADNFIAQGAKVKTAKKITW